MRAKYSILQICIVLLIIPSLYTIRNHFNIIPTINMILPHKIIGISDNIFFISAWLTIIIIDWLIVAAIILFTISNGYKLNDFGYYLNFKKTTILLLILILFGFILFIIKTRYNISLGSFINYKFPSIYHSSSELLIGIFLSINAGFCEEIAYRGFAITALKDKNLPYWLVIVIPVILWILNHDLRMYGSANITGILFLFANGLLFSFLFLWKKNLTYPILLHAVSNLIGIIL